MSVFKQVFSVLGKTPHAPVLAPVTPVERRSRQRRTSHKGRRVLIIDDSTTIVAALGKMLRSAGCVTQEAADAEKGLELARREIPDLVFLDIVLPGMNGFAALRLMRRDPLTQRIPVIMISGNEQATEQFYAKRIGADESMCKPFSRSEVFSRAENLVENAKLARLPDTVAVGERVSTVEPARLSRDVESTPLAARVPAMRKIFARESLSSQAPDAVSATAPSALDARRQLTAMGLQYFSQEQFMAAIQRWDQVALGLFIVGGGVDTDRAIGGKSLFDLARVRGNSAIAALLERRAKD